MTGRMHAGDPIRHTLVQDILAAPTRRTACCAT